MTLSTRRLRDVFRVALLSAASVACGEKESASDASLDATSEPVANDANEAATEDVTFGSPDAWVWCDAGPPIWISACGGCCENLEVPCGIAPDAYDNDAGSLFLNDCAFYCSTDPHPDGATSFQACHVVSAVTADASDDAATYVQCGCTGRRFAGYRAARVAPSVGGYFANMARLEAASVFAFRRLARELVALRAPSSLVDRARGFAREEKHHTRLAASIAARFGEHARAPRAPRFALRHVERIARENAIEGCVRETYGALVAAWQASHAQSKSVRRVFRRIARDETRHAALAWRVADLLDSRIDDRTKRRIASARKRALVDLRAELDREPSRELVGVAGVPSRREALALFDGLGALFA